MRTTPPEGGNLYSLSYDDVILKRFAQARGIEIPKLELGARKSWLEEQKLHEEFERFQIAHWRERCRALRQAVDRHDPTFQFCIYPGPGTPFMLEAALPEWSTAQAPIILADPWIYGRPSRFLPQAEALEANRRILQRGIETAKAKGVPFLYAGGIDPVVPGADPEFSGKNAVMSSETTDGYWIFYEGPTYTKQDHADYWKWFTWANHAIAGGRPTPGASPARPKRTGRSPSSRIDKLRKLILPQVTGKRVVPRGHPPRREPPCPGSKGRAAGGTHPAERARGQVPLAPYLGTARCLHAEAYLGHDPGPEGGEGELHAPEGRRLPVGRLGRKQRLPRGQRQRAGFSSLARIQPHLWRPAPLLPVPQGIDRFTLRATGSGGDGRVTVHDPAGKGQPLARPVCGRAASIGRHGRPCRRSGRSPFSGGQEACLRQ